MTLEESWEVIPMMETMINQIEEQQNLMAAMVQELQERDRQLLSFQEQNQSLKSLNSVADKIKANRGTIDQRDRQQEKSRRRSRGMEI